MLARCYNKAFSEIPELEIPADDSQCQHAWHLYLLRLNLDKLTVDRSRFIVELKKRNIGTSVHFIPLHAHPYYRDTYGYAPEDFPVAFQEYRRVISLPIYSTMTDVDVDDVIDSVISRVTTFCTRKVFAVTSPSFLRLENPETGVVEERKLDACIEPAGVGHSGSDQ